MAAFCAGSCTENLEPPRGSEFETDVVLHLNTGSTPSYTRADGKDSAAQNEEAIRRVDLFFFKSDADGKRMEGEAEDLFYVYEIKCENFTSADVSVKLPVELAEKFTFVGPEDGYRAYVYALVNLPATIGIDEEKKTVGGKKATYDVLQELWVSTTAFTEKNGPSDFVMRGGSPITMVKQGRYFTASGTIMLERLASKIRLWAAVPDRIYVDPETGKTIVRDQYDNEGEYEDAIKGADIWEPVTTDHDPETGTEMSTVGLYLYNLTTNGRIDGSVSAGGLAYADIDRDPKYEEVVRRLEKIQPPAAGQQIPESIYSEEYPYTHTLAYYSYPNVWVNSASEDNHQTYLMIRLPWRKQVGGGFEIQNFYYQVPVNVLKSSDGRKENCLEANRYYRVKINIGMLGSKDLGDPLEVNASCEVVPWQTANVDVSIKGRRYLVVNQTEWTMNNVWTLEIPFSSSHPVEIEDCYVTYFRYNDVWGTDPLTNGVHEMEEFDKWIEAAEALKGGKETGEGLITASYGFIDGQTTEDPVTEFVTTEGRGILGRQYPVYEVVTTVKRDVSTTTDNELYYKPDYFYDRNKGEFIYYMGHEHPKTIQNEYISFNQIEEFQERADYSKADQQRAWELYKDTYGIDSVYTCSIDYNKGVIRFVHPLVQWREISQKVQKGEPKTETKTIVEKYFDSWYSNLDLSDPILRWRVGAYLSEVLQTVTTEYERELLYYVPEMHPRIPNRLWDEFSRCEIVIKVKHKDWDGNDDLYKETVHITQYPGMYVEVSHNYGGVYESGNKRGNQYIRVNGSKTEYEGDKNTDHPDGNAPGTSTEWFEVTGTVTYFGDVNNNPNMYVIHTSQLSEEDEILYDIGDPRTMYYNNLLDDNSFTNSGKYDDWSLRRDVDNPDNKWPSKRGRVQGVYENGRLTYIENYSIDIATDKNGKKLTRYYPVDESTGAGSKENFIAPSFRIASSLGKVALVWADNDSKYAELEGLGRTEARRRCASYQEGGRPAGRWRMPTVAEIKYLVRLSSDGKIPHLFGHQTLPNMYVPYWSSGGILGVRLKDNDVKMIEEKELTTAPAVRCVYDEWYWNKVDGGKFPEGLNDLTEDFYWGDVLKDNPQAPAPTVLRTPSFSTKK